MEYRRVGRFITGIYRMTTTWHKKKGFTADKFNPKRVGGLDTGEWSSLHSSDKQKHQRWHGAMGYESKSKA